MDKEVMQNLVHLYNHTLHDISDLRKVIKARINSNNAPQDCCTTSRFYINKAVNRHRRKTDYTKTDYTIRCTNSKQIAIFKKAHKDKPDFRPTTPADFHMFNELGNIDDRIRDKFMPVLSEGQETELGWKELIQVLRNTISAYLDMPKGMYLLHHAHISVEDPRLIAYYPSLQHLTESIYAGDPNLRAVKVKLGKYLTAYKDALGLSEVQIKETVEKYNGHLAAKVGWKVKFIEHDDPDGWFKVYAMKGEFTSCMTGNESVKLYAHDESTLRLAYIESGDGKAVARCIVRDEGDDTGYVRLYGESEDARVFLRSWLADNGYPEETSLEGCLLPLVGAAHGDGVFLCPYIDSGNSNAQMAEITTIEDKRYLIICEVGEYKCEYTDGTCSNYDVADEDYSDCSECGSRTLRDDITYIEGESICEGCIGRYYTYAYVGSCEEYVRNCSTTTWDYQGSEYTQEGLDHYNLAVCTYDGEVNPICDMVTAAYYGDIHIDNASRVDHIDEDKHNTQYVLSDDVHTLSDSSTCHKADAEYYEELIANKLDEDRPRIFVIPTTATAVQLYAYN
jgi:hypothetical protein